MGSRGSFHLPAGAPPAAVAEPGQMRGTVPYCSSGSAGPGANPGAGALAPPVHPWWIGPVPGGASSNPQEVSDLPQRVCEEMAGDGRGCWDGTIDGAVEG